MGQSLASLVTLVGQEKFCVFLICSQEIQLLFQEKSQEKLGKTIREDVYEPCLGNKPIRVSKPFYFDLDLQNCCVYLTKK